MESETQLDAANAIEECPDVAPEQFPTPIGKFSGSGDYTKRERSSHGPFEASGRYANPMGTLRGGVLCDLADAAMGVAYRSTLAEGETFTTIELKINFLRPVIEGRLRAIGRVVEMKQTLFFSEADVIDEKGRLVARASSTCMPVPEGQGRE